MQTLEEMHAHYKAVKARLASRAYKEPVLEKPKQITRGERILIETANRHKISVKDLKSGLRTNKLVDARRECMYRLRTELRLPLTAIAKFMNRDHTSVLHALRRYEKTRLREAGKVEVSDA